jgi:hypothetical protein
MKNAGEIIVRYRRQSADFYTLKPGNFNLEIGPFLVRLIGSDYGVDELHSP